MTEDRDIGFGDDEQSDLSLISVSTVHTRDLSDFEPLSSDGDEPEWMDFVLDHQPQPFTSHVGPKKPLGLNANPIDYFLQLFPVELFSFIADQTNLYAQQKNARNFDPTCTEEIRAYIGLLFCDGAHTTV